MRAKEWSFEVAGQPHALALDIGVVSQILEPRSAAAGCSLSLDGKAIAFRLGRDHVAGAELHFDIAGRQCSLLVRRGLFSEEYDLLVEGRSVLTGEATHLVRWSREARQRARAISMVLLVVAELVNKIETPAYTNLL